MGQLPNMWLPHGTAGLSSVLFGPPDSTTELLLAALKLGQRGGQRGGGLGPGALSALQLTIPFHPLPCGENLFLGGGTMPELGKGGAGAREAGLGEDEEAKGRVLWEIRSISPQ